MINYKHSLVGTNMEKVKHFADLVKMSHIHFSMLTLQIRSQKQEHSVQFIFIDIILLTVFRWPQYNV